MISFLQLGKKSYSGPLHYRSRARLTGVQHGGRLGGYKVVQDEEEHYGNIEDLMVRVRMVTLQGTMERNFLVSERGGASGNLLVMEQLEMT